VKESIAAYTTALTALSVVVRRASSACSRNISDSEIQTTLLASVHIGFLSAMLTLQNVDLTVKKWQLFKYFIYAGTISSVAGTTASVIALVDISDFSFNARNLACEDPTSLPYGMLRGQRIDLEYLTNRSGQQALLRKFGMSKGFGTTCDVTIGFLALAVVASFAEVVIWTWNSEEAIGLPVAVSVTVGVSAVTLYWAMSRGAWALITRGDRTT
jgi:hypothetical protein